MKTFSFTALCDSLWCGLVAAEPLGKDRLVQSFSQPFPQELYGPQMEISRLLTLLYLWVFTKTGPGKTTVDWTVKETHNAGLFLEGRIVFVPTGSPDIRDFLAKSSFRPSLEALKGRVLREEPFRLEFGFPIKRAAEAPSLPLDLDMMVKNYGDPEVCTILISGYLQEAPKLLGGIEEGLKEKDPRKVHRLAHSLKGGALNIHAQDLGKAALTLEKEAKEDRLENGSLYLEKIRREYLTVSEYFTHLKKERSR